jgi:hypothetical protein
MSDPMRKGSLKEAARHRPSFPHCIMTCLRPTRIGIFGRVDGAAQAEFPAVAEVYMCTTQRRPAIARQADTLTNKQTYIIEPTRA